MTTTAAASLASPSPLSLSQRRAYVEQGFVVARGVVTPAEIEAAAQEAEALVARHDLIDVRNLRCRWQPRCEDGECLFETFDPVVDIAPVCASLAWHPRLLAVLGDIYGEPAR